MATPTTTYETYGTARTDKPQPRVSWAAIFVGAILTIAIGLPLLSLGAALGLTTVDPARADMQAVGWGTGFWSLLTIIVATFLGAFVAVRTSNLHERRDAGMQGLAVWGVSFVLMMVLLAFLAVAGGAIAAPMVEPAPGQQQPVEAVDVGAAVSWWYFISAALAAGAGILGGLAGHPTKERHERESRERVSPGLRTRETPA
jgi:formate hydrogenlyase subunit 3/multisubunit Na+/H+ antiporter MnhD subunit